MNKTLKPFLNIGPGRIINRNLESLGWSQKDLAEVLGMAPNIVNELILHKRKITVDIARKLAKAFNSSPEFWMNLEVKYRLNSKINSAEEKKLKATEIKALIRKHMPIADMAKKGWIEKSKSLESLIETYQSFWNCKKLDFSFYENNSPSFLARKSNHDASFTNNYSITWLQMAHKISGNLKGKNSKYNEQNVRQLAMSIPEYTIKKNGVETFIDDLSNFGINFFILSHLPKTYLDGAAFQFNNKRYIVYTKRHDRVDNFWFTMAHELAHQIEHINDNNDCFLDNLDEIAENKKEKEADAKAAIWLKTDLILKLAEPNKNYLTDQRLNIISENTGIEKSVVLGILQYNKMIDYRKLNHNKKKISDFLPKEYYKG